MRTCQTNGQWSGTVPTCVLIDCGALSDPENGFVMITPGLVAMTGVRAVANYDCNEYIIIGESVRTCQENGQWNGTSPMCLSPASCMAEQTIVAEDGNIRIMLDWPNTLVGQMVFANCTCSNITIGSASRVCGGDAESRGMWEAPDNSVCRFTETVRKICQLANQEALSTGETLEVLDELTAEEEKIGAVGVSVATSILEKLVSDVMQEQNRTMVEDYLTVVDNILEVDPMELQESQQMFNTSARLLETVEAVAIQLPIPENDTQTVIILTSFAVAAQDIQVENIRAQTFSAVLGTTFDSKEAIESKNLVFDVHPNATASITVPASVFMAIQLPSNMSSDTSIRIANSVYLNDLLFLQRDRGTQQIGSIIISTSISSNNSFENLNPPVFLSFTKTSAAQNGTNTTCNFWDPTADSNFGDWSTRGCSIVNETEEDVICECDHLTSFAILLDKSVGVNTTSQSAVEVRKTLQVLSYIGAILSICLLVLTIATYLLSKKLRSSANQLFINLCFGLLGIYITYIFSFHATPVPELCVLAGVLVQYFLLATFFAMAADAINVFKKLIFVFVVIRRYVVIATIVCWFVPAIIVAVTVAPDYNNYVGINFCRPYDVQFFAGLLAPILLIYLFKWIVFVILMGFLLHRYCKAKVKLTKKSQNRQLRQQLKNAIALSLLFGLGWGFGLPGIDNDVIRTAFQIVFVILTAFQGLYVFILQCLTGRNAGEARKEWKRWFYRVTCRPDLRKLLDRAVTHSASKFSRLTTTDTSLSLITDTKELQTRGKKGTASTKQNTRSLPLPIPENEDPQTDTPVDRPGPVPDTSLLLPKEQNREIKE